MAHSGANASGLLAADRPGLGIPPKRHGATVVDNLDLDLVAVLLGRLPAPIQFGMGVRELISCIGPTRSVAAWSSRDSRSRILRYGDIEFHFGDAGFEMLFSDTFVASPQGDGALSVESGWLVRGLQVDAVYRHLSRCGALLRKIDDPWNEGCCDVLIDATGVLKFRIRASAGDEQLGLVSIMVLAESAHRQYERTWLRRPPIR